MRVFAGLLAGAVLALGTSAAIAVPVVVTSTPASWALIDPSSTAALPTGANWEAGFAAELVAGSEPSKWRSPFDDSGDDPNDGGFDEFNAIYGPTYDGEQLGYYSVGPENTTSEAHLLFGDTQKEFSLLWGSLDSYNKIEFLLGTSNVVYSLLGSDLGGVMGGGAAFVTFSGFLFNEVRFYSEFAASEFSSMTSVAVPLPPALLLFGSGIFGLGLLASRRKRAGSTSGAALA